MTDGARPNYRPATSVERIGSASFLEPAANEHVPQKMYIPERGRKGISIDHRGLSPSAGPARYNPF